MEFRRGMLGRACSSSRRAVEACVLIAVALLGYAAGRLHQPRDGPEQHTHHGMGMPVDVGRRLTAAEQPDGSRPFTIIRHSRKKTGSPYALVSTLHIANVLTEDGQLIPNKWKDRIIIELGANHIYTVAQSLFKQKVFSGKYFVLSFEPVLDKYAANLADASYPGKISPVGYHNPRGLILPFAVGPNEGIAQMNVPSGGAGCATLGDLNPTGKAKRELSWGCELLADVRRTPVVTLYTVLGWLPSGSEVAFLKVDIQRLDLQGVLSAGDRIKRVQRVQMEVSSGPNEHGSGSCYEAVSKMAKVGYRVASEREIAGFAPLNGAYGTPLVYAGGPLHCNHTMGAKMRGEVDVFFIREDPPVDIPFHIRWRAAGAAN
jgi:hypothetical protein